MSATPLRSVLKNARLRGWLEAAAFALPWLLLASWWNALHPGSNAARAGIIAALLLFALLAWRTWHDLDLPWLVRRLDAQRKDMDDSSGLLLREAASLPPLQQLQRARLLERLRARPAHVQERWHLAALASNAAAALCVGLLALQWPVITRLKGPTSASSTELQNTATRTPILVSQALTVIPPGYTGLPTQRQDGLDARAVAGSTLRWQLSFDMQPTSVGLQFADGRMLQARRDGEEWIVSAVAKAPALYRIVTVPALGERQSQLHRIEVLDDQPPEVRNVEPQATLNMMQPGQRGWSVVFEATDDFGVAATATLRIIQTQGEGENITFKEHSIQIAGSGPPTRRRFSHGFDLRQSGITVGNDLIAQLIIRDTRTPDPHVVRSAGIILRWPPEQVQQSGGLDGLVKKALPAYLRSQRQIIIDTEKLLAQKSTLPAEEFKDRSNAIGLDQHALRIRYGQFMGEEDEGGPGLPSGKPHDADAPPPKPKLPPMPTNDVDESPTAAAPAEEAHHDDDGHDHGHDDGHDHGGGAPALQQNAFQKVDAMLSEGAHVHDLPEAATLLDPQTREILRLALREMWSAEGELRSGNPQSALPFEHRALEYIKKAQQADRVYLPRMGGEMPPIDDSRRMTGKREGLAPRLQPMIAADRPEANRALTQLWAALARPSSTLPLELSGGLSALQRVSGSREALDAIAAADRLQRDPACQPCRAGLRDALWPLLPRQTPVASPRPRNTRSGDAYLDALEKQP